MSNVRQAPSRVPEFKTVQEEAEFWDTHSTADFEDWWEPTDVEFGPDVRSFRLVTVMLEYSLYEQLRARAKDQGVTAEELAATWLETMLAQLTEIPSNRTSASNRAYTGKADRTA